MTMVAHDVILFWFSEIDRSLWFAKNVDFDRKLKERFLELHAQVSRGETFHWRSTAEGRLAEIIVLDQFSRNMFRDTPEAFAYDTLALILAQEALAQKVDEQLDIEQRAFLFMPFMHSESPAIHREALKLFSKSGLESNLKYEMLHKQIIDRFGRYPHRNEILGRESTPEEIKFLEGPDSSF